MENKVNQESTEKVELILNQNELLELFCVALGVLNNDYYKELHKTTPIPIYSLSEKIFNEAPKYMNPDKIEYGYEALGVLKDKLESDFVLREQLSNNLADLSEPLIKLAEEKKDKESSFAKELNDLINPTKSDDDDTEKNK